MTFPRADSMGVPRPGEGRSCAFESCAPRAVRSVEGAVDTGCDFGQQLRHPDRGGRATASRLRNCASPPRASAWRLTPSVNLRRATVLDVRDTDGPARIRALLSLATFSFYRVL